MKYKDVKCEEDCMQRGEHINCYLLRSGKEKCLYYASPFTHEEIERLFLSMKKRLEAKV